MKKIFYLFVFVFMLLVFNGNVKALGTVFYVNNNGVKFTLKEYNYFYQYFGLNYIDSMTMEDYHFYDDLDINNSNIRTSKYIEYTSVLKQGDGLNPKGATLGTPSKDLLITSSCNNAHLCNMMVRASWNINPTYRSNDIIGARFLGAEWVSHTSTRIRSSSGVRYANSAKVTTLGYGMTVPLPTLSTDITIESKFVTEGEGRIYGSYQHAQGYITSLDSKEFVISSAGYGSVFWFFGNAYGIYDGMGGVYIDV